MACTKSSLPSCLAAIITAAIITSTIARGADWPTYQHDNRRTGVTSEQLAPPLSLDWVFQSPFPPAKGWSRPVDGYGATKNASNVSFDDCFPVTAVGDMVYFCCSAENIVYAVDAAKGSIQWTFYTNAPPRLAPTVYQDKVYFGSDDGTAYCIKADDGTLVWKIRAAPTREKMLGTGRFLSLWPIRTGVMIERGRAYFTAGLFPSEGIYFYAADAATGEILWRRKLDRGGLGAPSPQGYLLATPPGQYADSIYMTSRVAPTRWSIADGSPIQFSTPIPHHEYRFHNGGSYAQLWGQNIVYGQAAILAYNPNKVLIDKYNRPQKGELIFNWFNARRVLFNQQTAYLATDYHLLAVKQKLLPELASAECKEFEQAYKKHRVASYLTALETLAEHGEDSPLGRRLKETSLKWGRESFQQWPAVLSGDGAEKLFARFARKCEWMLPIKANEAMILAGSVIYAGGEDRVVAVDSNVLPGKGGRQLWTANTGSRVRALTVANGRLLVSTIDGNIRCYVTGTHNREPKQVRKPATRQPYANDKFSDFYANVAERIIADSGVRKGYCLILSGGTGRLALEIAKRSQLNVYVLESDAQKVRQARRTLTEAGLYGGRVTVEQSALESLPFPPYVFNLVIDQATFFGRPQSMVVASTPPEEVFRVTKPCGGVAYFGRPPGSERFVAAHDAGNLSDKLGGLEELGAEITIRGDWAKVVRHRVKGSADWTHNYATAANTYCNEDPLVKGPFGILWYGQPGPRKRIERHAAGPVPLVAGGTMFLIGYDRVMAYDIYNGVPYWNRTIVGATRTGLPMGTSNMVADDTSLFIVIGNRECLRLDAKTGETVQTYPAPQKAGARDNFWGWIAKHGNLLYGSRSELDAGRRRANPKTSQSVFALDVRTGRLRWMYQGKGIEHDGIAIGDGKVMLVDRNLTDRQRQQAIAESVHDASVEDRPAVLPGIGDARGNPIEPDLRKLVALDAATGTVKWQKPLNVTDVTLDDMVVSSGRVAVACMIKDNVVVVHGTGSLGHPYQEFMRGEFKRRAIYAFSGDAGKRLWGGRRNYRKRPIIVGDYIYAEPHAWHLKTGEPKTYVHPISGKSEQFDFFRGYIGCSHLLASGAALFGNFGGIAHLNLDENCGYTSLGNMSLACGLGAVPAGGIFVAPEGRSGCTCTTPIFTSIALYPRRPVSGWKGARTFSSGIPGGVSSPVLTPVRHVAINLGAPGFRQDDRDTLWIPYPARGGEGILGKWLPKYQHNATMFYGHGEDFLPIEGTNRPWLFTSGYAHDKPLSFKLIDPGGQPASYTVRLYFAEPDDVLQGERAQGQRVFDVSLQGRRVLDDFDVVREAGGIRKALIKEFRAVKIEGDLIVGLKPADHAARKTPILCAIEAIRE